MKKAKTLLNTERDDSEVNLTPLLDVVFIMLIFFIVTATFIREAGVPATRTQDSLEQNPDAGAILITLDANDLVWIDGLEVDQRAIRSHIERLHAVNPDWPVVIDPKASSTTKLLVAAIDAARASNIDDIAITGGSSR